MKGRKNMSEAQELMDELKKKICNTKLIYQSVFIRKLLIFNIFSNFFNRFCLGNKKRLFDEDNSIFTAFKQMI